jgi:hypothetical protein
MNPDSIPAFLWLVGIEGSGHFLLRSILRDYLSQSAVIDKGPHYPLLIQRWDVEQQLLPQPAVANTLARVFEMYEESGVSVVYEDTSFPFGGFESKYAGFVSDGSHRGALRCPDILDLVRILEGIADVRIIVAYRSPVLTVSSALRRGFSNNLEFECRLAEAIHLHITSQLAQLPQRIYRTFEFEDFLARPEEHVEALAAWWGIPIEILSGGLERIRKTGTMEDIPPSHLSRLSEFFTDQRLNQWTRGYQTNRLLGP